MTLGINTAAPNPRNPGDASDPFKSFSFCVEVEGILVGGFTSVEGLESRTEVRTVREGGVNDTEYKLPGQVSYSDLVLRSGLTAQDPMWLWYRATLSGQVRRRNGSIYLLDDQGMRGMGWDFFNAWPTAWQGPSFDAGQALVALQSFTLAHEGIRKSQASAGKGLS